MQKKCKKMQKKMHNTQKMLDMKNMQKYAQGETNVHIQYSKYAKCKTGKNICKICSLCKS